MGAFHLLILFLVSFMLFGMRYNIKDLLVGFICYSELTFWGARGNGV